MSEEIKLEKATIVIEVKYDANSVDVEDLIRGFEQTLYNLDGVETWNVEVER
ncbi:MAG: hypothetical protein ACXQS5_05565 [Candidatus Methanospirareceae archaeon]